MFLIERQQHQHNLDEISGVGTELFINSIEEARDFLVHRMVITAEEIDTIIQGLQDVRHNPEQYTMVVQRNQLCAVPIATSGVIKMQP